MTVWGLPLAQLKQTCSHLFQISSLFCKNRPEKDIKQKSLINKKEKLKSLQAINATKEQV